MYLRVFLFIFIFQSLHGCGIITHIEISHRAIEYFQNNYGSSTDYAKLMRKHPDALIAGSPYPDAYYDSVCFDSEYHDVSEDTHWAPFLKVAVDYIRQKYPQPWDEATEKLVVFMFGVVSHQVADIVWHSLGIDQGFLSTMGDINFHGSFGLAHPVGDLGGDVLTAYEMNVSYIPLTQGWYIPTEDLFNIYSEYYKTKDKMPMNVIVDCTTILYLGRLGEHLAFKEIFTETAQKSPFLVDQFERYFLGGVDDMAGWTDRIWHETITMFEKGTDVCSIPKSTLFLQCNSSNSNLSGYRKPSLNGKFIRPRTHGVSNKDFTAEKVLRGVLIKPTATFLKKIKKKSQKMKMKSQINAKHTSKHTFAEFKRPDKVLYVRQPYSRLGEQYATGDLNFDGFEDLVVTAPGYSRTGSPQEGRVFIIHGDSSSWHYYGEKVEALFGVSMEERLNTGSKDGILTSLNPDLDDLEISHHGQILKGWGTAQSRFGTSVAVLDINLDGADDIAIGAPAFTEIGTSPLQYNGYILVYFGIPSKHMVANGAANITIVCSKMQYCNLGFSMTTSDINGDGHPDLVFGSPFAPSGGEQRGLVSALMASKWNTGYQYIDVTQLPWKLEGSQDYGWFGYSIVSGHWYGSPVLFVNQPEFRKCQLSNCSYNINDIQAVGKVTAYYGVNQSKTAQWTGLENFDQLGWNVDVGTPFPDKTHHVIAVTKLGTGVNGSIAGMPSYFSQVGQVLLYNSTSGEYPTKPSFTIQGDRMYERFGSKVKFADVNGDGLSDLLIGASFRSEDFTEELQEGEEGLVYIYLGGEKFPYDTSKTNCGNSIIHPCPQYQASMVLQWTNPQPNIRFGSNFVAVRAAGKTEVFVTAQHSSDYARMAGAIGVFVM